MLGVQATGIAIATDGVLAIETVVGDGPRPARRDARAPTNLVLELITDRHGAGRRRHRRRRRSIATLPGAETGELPVDGGIELIFDEPIDLDRARAGGIAARRHRQRPRSPTVIESHGAAVVVRPTAPLAYSARATASCSSDVADVAGNALAIADTAQLHDAGAAEHRRAD